MMLQLGAGAPLEAREGGWTVHLRVGPERVFYSLVEFEVLDPDGYRICVGGAVPGGVDVPAAREREETAH
jgi:hypothetical protein